MVRIDTVYELVKFITNKELSGNTMTIEQFNRLCEMVNIDILKERYGLPQQYQPGQPMPQMTYEATQKLMDDLRHLKVRTGVDVPAISIDQWGRAIIPSNYLHLSSARFNRVVNNDCENSTYKPTAIELLTDAQIADRTGNSVTMPTEKHPCMAIFNNYFQFYPISVKRVELTYLRLPLTPLYNSEIVNDEEIYVEVGSIHFEYPQDLLSTIVKKILSYVNVNLEKFEVVNYAEMKDKQG